MREPAQEAQLKQLKEEVDALIAEKKKKLERFQQAIREQTSHTTNNDEHRYRNGYGVNGYFHQQEQDTNESYHPGGYGVNGYRHQHGTDVTNSERFDIQTNPRYHPHGYDIHGYQQHPNINSHQQFAYEGYSNNAICQPPAFRGHPYRNRRRRHPYQKKHQRRRCNEDRDLSDVVFVISGGYAPKKK